MNAITSNKAVHQLDELIHQVNDNYDHTIILSENGDQAVLMSLSEFESWQETCYLKMFQDKL